MTLLSQTDRRLLDALQQDLDRSQQELADIAGVSRTACWRRLKELDEAKIIDRRVALLNPEKLGLPIFVLLFVSMTEHSDAIRDAFEGHVAALPEIMECYAISGDRDYLLHVITRSVEDYDRFLNRKILHHPSVRSASSSFALRRMKYTTRLPLNGI